MSTERCPTCNQRVPPAAVVRLCSTCGKQIKRHDKWVFVTVGSATTIRHRVCEDPTAYKKEATA